MKIELIKYTFDNGDVGYKYKSFEYCCNNLKDNPVIHLVHEYTVRDNDYFVSMSIWQNEIEEEYGEIFEYNHYYKINYCPFCSEPIEISVVEEMDLSELYDEYTKQRDELNEERRYTDSIKKKNELNETIRDLDKKIDWFYQLYEWDGSVDSIGK